MRARLREQIPSDANPLRTAPTFLETIYLDLVWDIFGKNRRGKMRALSLRGQRKPTMRRLREIAPPIVLSALEICDTPALDSCSFPPATVLAVWLSSEDSLGRVGTLKWSSLATSGLILLMALSYGTTALFVPLSALTILAIGEYCVIV